MKVSVRTFLLFAAGMLLLGGAGYSGESQAGQLPELSFFYSPACHTCHDVMKTAMPALQQRRRDAVRFRFRNLDESSEYQIFFSLKETYKPQLENSLPILFLNGHFLNGKDKTADEIDLFIAEALARPLPGPEAVRAADLTAHFATLRPALIAAAGLIDGINPCAFTVMVFFVSYLTVQGYRKRHMLLVGLAFLSAVFCAYLAIGIGLFRGFFSLMHYWVFVKIFNYGVGTVSLALGALSVYDACRFGRTGRAEAVFLQLPPALKTAIHRLIGERFRLQRRSGLPATGLSAALRIAAAAFVTGLIVSLLEAVCTGQAYVPTLAFVLKDPQLRVRAFGYLVLYNVMFVVPLLAILLAAVGGVTSQQFSRFMQRHLFAVKLLMAVFFFGFGAYLLWRF